MSHVYEHDILYFTHFAYCSAMGLCLAAYAAQNSTHANIKGRSAPAWSFRYFVHIKEYRPLIKISCVVSIISKSSIEQQTGKY
jgi:hypothetical protein